MSDDIELSEIKRELGKMVGDHKTAYHWTPESVFVMLGKIYPEGVYKDREGAYWFSVKVGTVEITWFKDMKS